MKIAVCGKGGCGKSTVTSLLAKALARRGKEILVIDSDESNYGLHRQLGIIIMIAILLEIVQSGLQSKRQI